jgi:hypothetical protein
MHFKNGREAKNGDTVVALPANGTPAVGILYNAVAGNNYCNGRLAQMRQDDPYSNLKECLHIDDVKIATIFNAPEMSVPGNPDVIK